MSQEHRTIGLQQVKQVQVKCDNQDLTHANGPELSFWPLVTPCPLAEAQTLYVIVLGLSLLWVYII